MEIVGEAPDGAEAVRLVELYRPDVVLMDVRMPVLDGIEATRAITGSPEGEATRVLILTTFDLDEYAFSALRAGASGFLLKDVPPAELVSAIRTVARGDAVVSPRITRRLLEEYAAHAARPLRGAGGDGAARRRASGAGQPDRARARGPAGGGRRAVQRGDRRAPLRLRGHRQVPRGAPAGQAGAARPRAGRRVRLPVAASSDPEAGPEDGTGTRRLVRVASPDLALGTFSDTGPWVIVPDELAWRRGLAGVRARLGASLPRLTRRRTLPPVRRLGTTLRHVGRRARAVVSRRAPTRRRGVDRRHLAPAAGGGRAAGPDLHQAGPDHRLGRRRLPARAGGRVQVVPRPGGRPSRGRSSSGCCTEELGGPLDRVFASVERAPLAAASIAQVHAATLRDGTPVVVKVQRPVGVDAGAPGPRRHGLAGAPPRRTYPGRRAGQPARAGRAVRGDDRRGARLPPRGREHARHRDDLRRARPARLRRPAPASRRS